MNKLVETLGITSLSKSQVSVMAEELDTAVEAFRSRPLGTPGPYTVVAADALVIKVREGGRVAHALIAVGVNAEGYREILGIDVTSAEDGASWLAFWRSLTARGLAARPNPLHNQPDGEDSQEFMAVGAHPVAFGVRPTRRGIRYCSI